MEIEPRHHCMIYEGSPSKKLGILASVIQRKMNEGFRCLYLNSAPMVAGMRSTLASLGVDVENEIAKTRLVLSSEPVTIDGDFNIEIMLVKLEESIDQAILDGYKGLWASGDMTWEFGSEKNFSKLMEYEFGLEKLFQKRGELCGVCQYHHDTLPPDALRQGLLTHPHILINETFAKINPHYLKSAWPIDQVTSSNLDEMIAAIINDRVTE